MINILVSDTGAVFLLQVIKVFGTRMKMDEVVES